MFFLIQVIRNGHRLFSLEPELYILNNKYTEVLRKVEWSALDLGEYLDGMKRIP